MGSSDPWSAWSVQHEHADLKKICIFTISIRHEGEMTEKTVKTNAPGKGEIVLYRSPDGKAVLDVRLEGATLWLTQKQLSELDRA